MMKVSVRESRLVLERLLLLTGLDSRIVPKVRDYLVVTEVVGGEAFQFMNDELLHLTDIEQPRLRITDDAEHQVTIDGGGQFAPIIAPSLLNLMSLRASENGSAALLVKHVRYPNLLKGIVSVANKRGLTSFVLVGDTAALDSIAMGSGNIQTPALVVSIAGELSAGYGNNGNAPADDGDSSCLILFADSSHTVQTGREDEETLGTELTHALHEGIPVEEELWWTLYHRSNDALSRTSEVSRTHAGPDPKKLFVEF